MDGILARGAQPLGDERDPHDDVADDGDPIVGFVERRGHAGGDDEDARDLHERQQPVLDVVGVECRGEPREVHPRPPDRQEQDDVAQDAVADLPVDEIVVEGARHLRDGDDEAQVEQQLERSRAAMCLLGVAAGHRHVPRTDDRARTAAGAGAAISGGSGASRS